MTKFKIGNRVKTRYGEGKIVKIDDSLIPYCVHLNDGTHWLFDEDKLELIKQSQTIHIYNDGTKTTAILKEGKKVVDKAEAICHKDDEFDFAIGADLAFNRLIDKEIKVGDTVKVVDYGKSYTTNIRWFKGNDYSNLLPNYLYNSAPIEGNYYEVVAKKEDMIVIKDFCSQLFLIELDGVKKVSK